ncbi:MAG: sulfide/dihydroorotate dehydrogenase-like FAD/NAD-binding protein [Deltaproteobacteria bacterium]|nr:sulfide/dihydroorotate dehydrogenase-like FAD/NAD-binding protein [Deltaproteobacteria bacterium]
MFKILDKREMADNTVCHFKIEAPLIAKKAKPGQFVVLRPNETGERIPLTMASTDQERGTIDIIFQVVGKTTALLRTFNKGDYILDIIGPLGRPTHLEKLGTVICVGGGTGIAVLYPITKALKETGNHVISIIGARTKDLLILEEEMRNASDELFITTDDGSYGRHGFVTDALKDLIEERKDVKLVVGIGPVLMMKFVCKTTEPYGVKTMVSLNAIMVDATGMCGACRVTVGGKTRFCCVDGPEFDGHQVDFDELMKRQAAYLKQERQSYDLFLEEHGQ